MPGYTPITPPNRTTPQQVPITSWWSTALKRINPNAFSFVIPFLTVFILFRIYPFIYGVWTSFTNAKIGPRPPKFIGLEHYYDAFTNSEVGRAFIVTFQYSIVVVPMTFFCGLFMAVYVNRKFPTHSFSRLVFFAPYILAATIVGLIWNWMFQTQFGLVNVGLGSIGLPSRIAWLKEPYLVLPVIAFITTWWQAGFSMVIFIAALQSIPKDLVDAARIDGANAWQIFWKVTFPLLLPASTLVMTITLIEAFRVFTLIYLITDGGPSDHSTTVVLYLFRMGFTRFDQGFAAAVGVLLFIVIMFFTVIRFVIISGEKRYY